MVKTRMAVCSLIVFALMLVMSSVQCGAEPSEQEPEPAQGTYDRGGFQPELLDIDVTVKIVIHPAGGNAWVIKAVEPKGPDICRGLELALCDGTQFLWTVRGHQMAAGDRVIIKKAPIARSCFEQDEWIIDGPDSAIMSGPITCVLTPEEAKYGLFWPYDVEFWKDGELKASTDPRGILH